MRIVILGLSITSSWGNGHATTYRALISQLVRRGHNVLFLERDQPWYAANRDLPCPPFGTTRLYRSVDELKVRWTEAVAYADAVIVGSFVPDGIAVGNWVTETCTGVTAFYDIDTPITLAKLRAGECDYVSRELVPRYSLYLSFTGGPTLKSIERDLGAPMARALYCSVDPTLYFPEKKTDKWLLGYLGTFSEDREAALNELLVHPAAEMPGRRFVVAGPQYPPDKEWPANVERIVHLNPAEHRRFYNAQRFTLNVTRHAMVTAGFSPSVRLFEAAACGTPIISDWWAGIETLFRPGDEILIAETARDVLSILQKMSPRQARTIGGRAQARVLAHHTAAHRAAELEQFIIEASQVMQREMEKGPLVYSA